MTASTEKRSCLSLQPGGHKTFESDTGMNVKGAICEKWPHVKFILQANRGQHINRGTAKCS